MLNFVGRAVNLSSICNGKKIIATMKSAISGHDFTVKDQALHQHGLDWILNKNGHVHPTFSMLESQNQADKDLAISAIHTQPTRASCLFGRDLLHDNPACLN